MSIGQSEKSRRRIGIATFATLFSLIALSAWFDVVFFQRDSHSAFQSYGPAVRDAVLAVSFVGGVATCVLAVGYLRHAYRSDSTTARKVLWTVLIVSFGPFAMAWF